MSDLLSAITEALASPSTVQRLLDPALDVSRWLPIPGTQWQAIPIHYRDSLARSMFMVVPYSGQALFVKISANREKLLREVRVCQFMSSQTDLAFLVPRVLGHGQTTLPTGGTIAWLAQEWVAGLTADGLADDGLLAQIAAALFSLHNLTVNRQLLEEFFSTMIPELPELAVHVRKIQLDYVLDAIATAPRPLRSPLKELRERLERAPFSPQVCIVHGDFHLNNVLVAATTGVDHCHGKVVIIDWEYGQLNGPGTDAAYIFAHDGDQLGDCFLDHYLSQVYRSLVPYIAAEWEADVWRQAGVWLARRVSRMYRESIVTETLFDEIGCGLEKALSRLY